MRVFSIPAALLLVVLVAGCADGPIVPPSDGTALNPSIEALDRVGSVVGGSNVDLSPWQNPLGPNLGLIPDITFSAPVQDGVLIQVTVSVSNFGDLALSDNIKVLLASDQGAIETKTIANDANDPIAPGGFKTVAFTWTPNFSQEVVELSMTVDPDGFVTEGDESNNLTTRTVPLLPIIFDYGPDTGEQTPGGFGGCWQNEEDLQNRAEQFSCSQDILITGIHIFTCDAPEIGGAGSVHINVFGDSDGSPEKSLYADDTPPLSWVFIGDDRWKVTALLPTPFPATANTTYWIGMRGNDPTSIGVFGVETPGDGSFATFEGDEFKFHSMGTGDLMFQLTGVSAAPTDNTPPVITPTVTGPLGENGWYTSDIEISWSVTDD